MRPTLPTTLAGVLLATGSERLSEHPGPRQHQPTTHNHHCHHQRRAVADPVPAQERGGSIPAAARKAQSTLAAGAAAATPQAALERYATLWSNWSAATVVADQRRLAAISLGQARAQALQAAASLNGDSTLAASHVANTGQVVAIAPRLATSAGAAGGWVVVTSEHTTGPGGLPGTPGDAACHLRPAHPHPRRVRRLGMGAPKLASCQPRAAGRCRGASSWGGGAARRRLQRRLDAPARGRRGLRHGSGGAVARARRARARAARPDPPRPRPHDRAGGVDPGPIELSGPFYGPPASPTSRTPVKRA